MPFDTYIDLQAEITNYLARSDLAAEIPSFIVLAEAKFNRSLKCVEMDQRANAAIDINSDEPQFLSLPRGLPIDAARPDRKHCRQAAAVLFAKRLARREALCRPGCAGPAALFHHLRQRARVLSDT